MPGRAPEIRRPGGPALRRPSLQLSFWQHVAHSRGCGGPDWEGPRPGPEPTFTGAKAPEDAAARRRLPHRFLVASCPAGLRWWGPDRPEARVLARALAEGAHAEAVHGDLSWAAPSWSDWMVLPAYSGEDALDHFWAAHEQWRAWWAGAAGWEMAPFRRPVPRGGFSAAPPLRAAPPPEPGDAGGCGLLPRGELTRGMLLAEVADSGWEGWGLGIEEGGPMQPGAIVSLGETLRKRHGVPAGTVFKALSVKGKPPFFESCNLVALNGHAVGEVLRGIRLGEQLGPQLRRRRPGLQAGGAPGEAVPTLPQ